MGVVGPEHSALLTVQPRDRRRRVVNRAMEVIASVAAMLAVAVLVVVIGSVVVKGIGAINFGFITQNPAPFGQPGGGIANSIVGTVELVAIASLIAIPIGILTGIYTAEFAPPWIGNSVRFALDILNGVPTIITGVFIFGILVVGSQQSGWAGAIALGDSHAADRRAGGSRGAGSGSALAARGGPRPRPQALAGRAANRDTHGCGRPHHRGRAGHSARRGRDGPSVVHIVGLLEPGRHDEPFPGTTEHPGDDLHAIGVSEPH